MKAAGKKFYSGRQVLKHYIKGYTGSHGSEEPAEFTLEKESISGSVDKLGRRVKGLLSKGKAVR